MAAYTLKSLKPYHLRAAELTAMGYKPSVIATMVKHQFKTVQQWVTADLFKEAVAGFQADITKANKSLGVSAQRSALLLFQEIIEDESGIHATEHRIQAAVQILDRTGFVLPREEEGGNNAAAQLLAIIAGGEKEEEGD